MVCDSRCLPRLRRELLRRYPAVALSSIFTLLTLQQQCWSRKRTTTYQAGFLFGLDGRSVSQPQIAHFLLFTPPSNRSHPTNSQLMYSVLMLSGMN